MKPIGPGSNASNPNVPRRPGPSATYFFEPEGSTKPYTHTRVDVEPGTGEFIKETKYYKDGTAVIEYADGRMEMETPLPPKNNRRR